MKKWAYISIPVIILVIGGGYYVYDNYYYTGTGENNTEEVNTPIDSTNSIDSVYMPVILDTTDENNYYIRHFAYRLSYNEQHEQANWVAYELTADETISTVGRTDDFRPDPLIPSGTATKEDYKGSGFDRGHLAPAGDMAWNNTAMTESFYFSNMSPQVPSFNRGIWKKLEEKVRKWAKGFGAIKIYTGPVLQDSLPIIGDNEVSVPEYYFKTLIVYNDSVQQGIAFLMKNEKSKLPTDSFIVTIDSIELLTGFDFYDKLSDSIQTKLEDTVSWYFWYPMP
jgi:endonuclease G, mitochondrial